MVITEQVLDALAFTRDGDGDWIMGGFVVKPLPNCWEFHCGREGGHRIETVQEMLTWAYSDGVYNGRAQVNQSLLVPPIQ